MFSRASPVLSITLLQTYNICIHRLEACAAYPALAFRRIQLLFCFPWKTEAPGRSRLSSDLARLRADSDPRQTFEGPIWSDHKVAAGPLSAVGQWSDWVRNIPSAGGARARACSSNNAITNTVPVKRRFVPSWHSSACRACCISVVAHRCTQQKHERHTNSIAERARHIPSRYSYMQST